MSKRRDKKELLELEQELVDKIWYQKYLQMNENGEDCYNDRKKAKKIRKKYGEEGLTRFKQIDYGIYYGKLSAIRWVLGEPWDNDEDK